MKIAKNTKIFDLAILLDLFSGKNIKLLFLFIFIGQLVYRQSNHYHKLNPKNSAIKSFLNSLEKSA
jgi:hypothetical protein